MCGRVRLSSDVSEIKLVFSIPPHRPTPNFAPSWNVAPTDPVRIVLYDTKAGERSLDVMRWSLVQFWAKDLKVGFSNINAKAEGIENKPAFREAFQRRPAAAELVDGPRRHGAASHARCRPDSYSHRRVRGRRLSTLRQCTTADGRVRRGGITKAGNVLARRVLIEGAWTYRMPARVSRKLYDRNQKLSPAIRDIALKGQIRLCSRYRRLAAAGKPKVVVTTAIAREMVGFIWAIARIPLVCPEGVCRQCVAVSASPPMSAR